MSQNKKHQLLRAVEKLVEASDCQHLPKSHVSLYLPVHFSHSRGIWTLPTTSAQILVQGLHSKNSSTFFSKNIIILNQFVSNSLLSITFHHPIYHGATQEVRIYYETFLACYNYSQNSIFRYLFTDRDITPCPTCHSKYSVISQKSSHRGDIPSKKAPIFGLWTYYETFWPFCTSIYIIIEL